MHQLKVIPHLPGAAFGILAPSDEMYWDNYDATNVMKEKDDIDDKCYTLLTSMI